MDRWDPCQGAAHKQRAGQKVAGRHHAAQEREPEHAGLHVCHMRHLVLH